jgi:hypothetical protein
MKQNTAGCNVEHETMKPGKPLGILCFHQICSF